MEEDNPVVLIEMKMETDVAKGPSGSSVMQDGVQVLQHPRENSTCRDLTKETPATLATCTPNGPNAVFVKQEPEERCGTDSSGSDTRESLTWKPTEDSVGHQEPAGGDSTQCLPSSDFKIDLTDSVTGAAERVALWRRESVETAMKEKSSTDLMNVDKETSVADNSAALFSKNKVRVNLHATDEFLKTASHLPRETHSCPLVDCEQNVNGEGSGIHAELNTPVDSSSQSLTHKQEHTEQRPLSGKCCTVTSTDANSLSSHVPTHTEEGPYLCEECDATFNSSGTFLRHKRKFHTEQKLYTCKICNTTYEQLSFLTSHLQSHTGHDPFSCKHCHTTFKDFKGLTRHMQKHKTISIRDSSDLSEQGGAPEQVQKPLTEQTLYRCKICDMVFQHLPFLTLHLQKHAGQRCNDNTNSDTCTHFNGTSSHEEKHTGQTPCARKECNDTFTKIDLLKHMQEYIEEIPTPSKEYSASSVTDSDGLCKDVQNPRSKQQLYKCKICDNDFDQFHSLTLHMQTHTEQKSYSCEECNATFSLFSSLNRHRRKHTGERPYSCKYCAASFADSHSLTRHMPKHTGERPYLCDDCGATFTNSGSLYRHKQEPHTEKKTYTCKICNATFVQSSLLTGHLLSHTGQDPYSCNFCNTTYTRFNTLTRHMRKHRGGVERPHLRKKCSPAFKDLRSVNRHKPAHSQLRPYLCEKCSATFRKRSALVVHMRRHTGLRPYMCKECGATFAQSSCLTVHKRIHTGVRPYSCTVCEATFTQKGTLTAHMRKHTGEKPYSCKFCGVKFTQCGPLRVHMRKFHPVQIASSDAKNAAQD